MNIPGIKSIEYYEADKVNLPFLSSDSSCIISDFTNEDPTPINFIQHSCILKVNKKETAAGEHFELNIPFTISGNKTEDIQLLKFLGNKRHIFVVSDNSNQKWLIGFNKGARPTVIFKFTNQNNERAIKAEIQFKTVIFPIYVTV